MLFQPDQITRENILQAIDELEKNPNSGRKSTGYDLYFEAKTYPPKEVLRRAHELATGDYLWKRSGGPQTNDFLINHGFEIKAKNDKPDPFPALVKDYKELLRKQGLQDALYKWELIETFRGRPDLEAEDLLSELKKINFSNLIYGPGIASIYHLARERSKPYRQCLHQLFDESVELLIRTERFTSTAYQLYSEIESDPKRQPHHDEQTIATLLTYHDPYRYTFYKDSFYRTLCKVIGEKPADPGKKYVDYLAIVDQFIEDYIQDDQELIDLVNQNKSVKSFGDPSFMLLAQDMLYRMLEINGRTFSSLIEEVGNTLNDDLETPRFSLIAHTEGNQKNRDWVWVTDQGRQMNTVTAHYELEVVAKKRDKIRICLHFEEENNNARFEHAIGKALPDGLQWFSWGNARSLRLKQEIDFYGEKTIVQVIAALKKIDTDIGDQVRKIITEINKEIMLQETRKVQPLNQILYGPPGTGKTYHTVNKALQLSGIDISAMSRVTMKAAFDKLVAEERIIFTSFHQSLGYEDFIEGLKPIIGGDDALPIQYQIQPGIFKNICNAARGLQDVKVQQEDIFIKAKFYKMSLGGLQSPHIHDWCVKNNYVALGWGDDKNFESFKGIKSWKDYRDKFVAEFPNLVDKSRYHITAMYAFQQMRVGDIVVVSKGNHIIDAIGKITGNYEWNDNNDFGYFQFRKVEWLGTGLNQQPATFFRKQISQQSIYEFFDDDVKKEVFIELFKSTTPEIKPYVLIIDEINRGNISKIFGELITLIEPDKRLGQAEGLTVTLPYTRDDFGVPANLYIIGTMNTADRSVEALDTALRRRFSFEEMQPCPELLAPAQVVWRFFGQYRIKERQDKDYLDLENDLFDLLIPDDAFKNESKAKWDSFAKESPKDSQIDLSKPYIFSGINLEKMLTTINRRLEVLKDRDHLIGHAYFINVYSIESLRIVFRDNLIPLLQEYFFGDYYKIQLVIGAGFIQSQTAFVEFAINDEDQYDEKEVYSIVKIALMDSNEFMNAVDLMKL